MRTTVSFEPDIAAAIEQLRTQNDKNLSATVNELIRLGLLHKGMKKSKYEHQPAALGTKVDVSNIAEVLELLDDE